jgi:beta-galactosidase
LQKYSKTPLVPEPPLPPRTAYGSVTMTASAPVLANIGPLTTTTNTSAAPLTMEAVKCPTGFMYYTTKVTAAMEGELTLAKLQDRAQVFVDGVLQGVAYRVSGLTVNVVAKVGALLAILMENMGRINFSHGMDNENKGILGGVMYGAVALTGWTSQCTHGLVVVLLWRSPPLSPCLRSPISLPLDLPITLTRRPPITGPDRDVTILPPRPAIHFG